MENNKPNYWLEPVPEYDDFGCQIKNTFIDGKTTIGLWGIMNPASHALWGVGLGPGKGQKYQRQEDGIWIKIN